MNQNKIILGELKKWKKLDYKNIWQAQELHQEENAKNIYLKAKLKLIGETVYELGTKVNPERDVVTFKDKEVKINNNFVYILLNKPIGYVTTVKDQFDRDTVLDLVKINKRIVPVRKT